MELTSLADCLKLAKTTTPEALGDIQGRLYTAAVELALTQAEVERVLKALKEATGVTLGSLRGDFAAYLKAHGLTAEKDSVATELVKLALDDGLELWHDLERNPWATLRVDGHLEHRPLKTKAVKRYLGRLYYEAKETAAHSQGLQDALAVLEAKAVFDGDEHETFVRLAERDGHVYLDLANDEWQAVEITPVGWRVLDSQAVPVRFRRSKGARPLPTPVSGGSLDTLATLLNLAGDSDDLKLVTAWLLQALRGKGPYPVLALTGEQGSGKSTTARVLRGLIDPNVSPLRTLSRGEHDMFIAASNSWCIAYENLRTVSAWVSDAICRLSTGGGLSTRELWTDQDETLLDAQRPVLLNGISGIIEEPDLVDRALQVTLPQIEDDDRETEEKFWARFDGAAPGILGALLDVVAAGLAALPHTQLERLPRMADFALWATACEEALGWPSGAFMKAYDGAKANLTKDALEAEPIAAYLVELAEGSEWTGTASALLAKLTDMAGYADKRPPKGWPGGANVLSKQLHRIAPALRSEGVEIAQLNREGAKSIKKWTLRIVAQSTDRTVGHKSKEGAKPDPDGKNKTDDKADGSDKTDDTTDGIARQPSAKEQRRGRHTDGTDGSDDKKTSRSKHSEEKNLESKRGEVVPREDLLEVGVQAANVHKRTAIGGLEALKESLGDELENVGSPPTKSEAPLTACPGDGWLAELRGLAFSGKLDGDPLALPGRSHPNSGAAARDMFARLNAAKPGSGVRRAELANLEQLARHLGLVAP